MLIFASRLVSIKVEREGEKKTLGSGSVRTRVVEECFMAGSKSLTSPQLPVFHLGHRPPRQRLCFEGLGESDWQLSSGTGRPDPVTQVTLRVLKPLPQAAEHCKMSKERRRSIEIKRYVFCVKTVGTLNQGRSDLGLFFFGQTALIGIHNAQNS